MLLKLSTKLCIPAIACLTALGFAISAQANSIGISYSLSGIGTVVNSTATTLTLDAQASGSMLSDDAALNAVWNPITYSDQSVLDLTTGLLQGNFTLSLQNGDTLIGTVDEDDSAVDASPTQTGPFTQTLTFTGGTGEFAGVTGSVSGNGFVGTTDFTVSGSGTLNSSPVPEPTPAAFLLAGLAILILGRRWRSAVWWRIEKTITARIPNLNSRFVCVSLIASALGLCANADTVAYIETSNPATGASGFGTLDLQTGAFQAIGPGPTDPGAGLVPAGGSLLRLGINGNLYSINPLTGVESPVGPTGLADC